MFMCHFQLVTFISVQECLFKKKMYSFERFDLLDHLDHFGKGVEFVAQ